MNGTCTIKRIYTVFEGEHNPGRMHNPGRHSDCFVFYDAGEADYLMEGYSFRARAGAAFFLAKGSVYDIQVWQKSKFICIDFDFEETQKERRSQYFSDVSPSLRNDFAKFFHLWVQSSPWQLPHAYSVLYHIYYELVRSENKQYAKSSRLMADVSAYILERYTDPSLSVSDMAAHAGISEVHLRRLFHERYGSSPIGYLHHLRLEKAKNMLRTSNYTVSEVALSVGYPDPYYFSRLFREKTGSTPSQYRKENKA